MIITNSNKPLRLIGIPESTMTQEGAFFIVDRDKFNGNFAIITPDEFIELPNKDDYQYLCVFALDIAKRITIINMLEKLDCFSYIDDSVVLYSTDIDSIVGRGSFIAPFSSILLNSKIGKHCIVETYCLVSHYCTVGTNVILHSGTMIAGKTTVGNNCEFKFKSSVLNRLTICDDVEIGAISTVTKDITQPGRYIGTIARYAGERIPFNA